MAYKEMQVAPIKDGGEKGFRFEYEESLSAAGDGNSILIPDDIQNVSIAVEPGGGSQVKFQYTLDKVETVKSGSPVWHDSDTGLSSSAYTDVLYPCTAVRLVQSGAGTSKIKVIAQ
jgi:hypothetical protein